MNFVKNRMDKQQWWPKEGKVRKGLIIISIVLAASLFITLLKENGLKKANGIPFIITAICVAVWFYQPQKEEKTD